MGGNHLGLVWDKRRSIVRVNVFGHVHPSVDKEHRAYANNIYRRADSIDSTEYTFVQGYHYTLVSSTAVLQ